MPFYISGKGWAEKNMYLSFLNFVHFIQLGSENEESNETKANAMEQLCYGCMQPDVFASLVI